MKEILNHGLAKDTDVYVTHQVDESYTEQTFVKDKSMLLNLSEGIPAGCWEIVGQFHCRLMILMQGERL